MDNRTYFQSNPVKLGVSRSTFPLNHKKTLTFNSGELVPLMLYGDVLPGDTFKVDLSFVLRSTTPRVPIMDDAEIQVEFYFVPHDYVLHRSSMTPALDDSNHSFAALMGVQDNLLNMPLPSDVELPSLIDSVKYSVIKTGTNVEDYYRSPLSYFGIPTGLINDMIIGDKKVYVNPLEALAFYKVWSDNYRDPNLMDPVTYSIITDANSKTGYSIRFTDNEYAFGGKIENLSNESVLPVVCAYHGYQGSALPWTQRNLNAVTLPLGTTAPVVTGSARTVSSGSDTMSFAWADGTLLSVNSERSLGVIGGTTGAGLNTAPLSTGTLTQKGLVPNNLWADLSQATAASVNAVRAAFQLQRWYEQSARAGNARLGDYTAAMFGVVPHDISDDRCEYLGGKRIPINATQVNQTAPSSGASVGSLGAFSNTSDSSYYFTKSFDKWGTIVCVACIRHKDAFGNVLHKRLTRKGKFDWYWPAFAMLGEQPIAKSEVQYVTTASEDAVFGYQEYAADYRYLPDVAVGRLAPQHYVRKADDSGNEWVEGDLAYWTYASELPETDGNNTLLAFIDAGRQVADFDRTLTTTHEAAGYQWLMQCYFDIQATRPMPLYSIPGLIDHN